MRVLQVFQNPLNVYRTVNKTEYWIFLKPIKCANDYKNFVVIGTFEEY